MSPSSKRGKRRQRPQPRVVEEEIDDSLAEAASGADEDEEGDEAYVRAARYDRLGPWAGIAYAVLGFVGSSLLPIGKVRPEDSAADIAKQLADVRGKVSAGILLTMLSLFFLLVFLSWLHRYLRDAEGEGGWLSTLALIGGTLLVVTLLVVLLLSIASTVLESYGPDPVIARTILLLQWQAVAIAFVPAAAFVGGTGLVGYTTGALPRWLSLSGLVLAAGLLLPPLAYLPFVLSTLWTGMLAVFLIQRSRFGF